MRAGRSDEGWREHKCRVRSFHAAGVNKQERVEMNTKQNIFLNMMGYTDFHFFPPKDRPKLIVFVLRVSELSLVPVSSCDWGSSSR